MAQKKKRTASSAAELEMTPMIDVVFQLLIYFVVTMKPMDIAAHLDVFSPGAPPPPEEDTPPPPQMLRIMIHSDGLEINDMAVSRAQMRTVINSLANISKDQTIMIYCASDSSHSQLVEVLDNCARVGLTNLSIITMD